MLNEPRATLTGFRSDWGVVVAVEFECNNGEQSFHNAHTLNINPMKREELLEKTTWDENEIGTCLLFVNWLEKEIPFKFFQDHQPQPNITEKMVETVNDILTLDKSNLETIAEMLWEECLFSFQISDYGVELQENESDLDANLREFGISNKQDAYSKSRIQEIHIDQENDKLNGRYAEIRIDSVSDNLISVIVKSGKLIDFDYDGVYLGSFEEDEQAAKRGREKTLNG